MVQIICDDCLNAMPKMPENSIDSIVTDPPYGLSFMGKDWDHGVPGEHFWRETLRVAKPGAHLLAFGGTRTFHRLACAIEDAGWEIRDCIMWVYGSGFPKSLDVSKAIDKAAGEYVPGDVLSSSRHSGASSTGIATTFRTKTAANPSTDAARQWSGWGTALKPAWEPVIVARKPLEGTVAENVQRYGTGAINIDECRVSYNEEKPNLGGEGYGFRIEGRPEEPNNKGRWPANVIHDGSEEVLELFPNTKSGKMKQHIEGGQYNVYGKMYPRDVETIGDTGSAARFFYCAKASREDRNEGNHHPTVKPTDLMRYLCRLVTPTGGVVLDPFMGSGSTGKAAVLEGFEFVGIEKEQESCEIAKARIDAAGAQLKLQLEA